MLVLAVETSCDETSAAVLRSPDGLTGANSGICPPGARPLSVIAASAPEVLSNVVLSQDEVHAPYGGVVPELASRQHIKTITAIIGEALSQAAVGLEAIDL